MSALYKAHDLYERLREATTKEEVLAIMDGASFMAFIELDERPGQFSGRYLSEDWFPLMRRLRNTPGSGLLENLS